MVHISFSISSDPSPLSLLNFGVQVDCFEGSWSCPTSKFMPFLILFGRCSCHSAHTQGRNGDKAKSGWPGHQRGPEKELGYRDCDGMRWRHPPLHPRGCESVLWRLVSGLPAAGTAILHPFPKPEGKELWGRRARTLWVWACWGRKCECGFSVQG